MLLRETILLTNSYSTVYFLKLLFGCPTDNFGSLLRGQPHSPNVNHCLLHFRPEGLRESRNDIASLNLTERLEGFKLISFQFLLPLNPLGHSPQKQCNSQPCRRKISNFFIMPLRTLNLFSTQNK